MATPNGGLTDLMCGIAGIFEFEPGNGISGDPLRRMTQTIVHRGPEDDGLFLGPGIGLGFRRLSIIDVAGGHQPISNEDGSIWVMLNGEIYNHPDLRSELEQRGHTFKTRSDTESIVHLYEECGDGCFARLRGMFAIELWVSSWCRLLLASDRVGKKRLYYATDHQGILFGSELKALLATGGVSRALDPQAVSDYFSLGYVPAPKSIYHAIRKLRPGCYLVAEN